ncbi:MAG: thiolase family protein [bacterium]|nr:thiolase family protein [bacterium]
MDRKSEVFIFGYKRTPFCEFIGSAKDGTGGRAGKLASLSAPRLGAIAAKGVFRDTGIPVELIGQIVFGIAEQNWNDDFYGARYIGLELGLVETPALTVARICGSGAEAIVTGARMIMLGETDFVLAGGAESLSGSPHVLRGLRDGVKLMQPPPLEDLFGSHLFDRFANLMMGGTANKLGEEFGLTREECDVYALASIERAAKAQDAGFFEKEIISVELLDKKGNSSAVVSRDDHIRRGTSLEELLSLRPVTIFGDPKKGLVTPGNASGMVDGAVALIIGNDNAMARGFTPIGKLVSWGISAVRPEIMGFGPVPAIKLALKNAGLTLDDLETLELNEAFAPVAVADMKALGFPHEKYNPNGGAIALGHPLGATGARLIGTVLNHLRTAKKKSFGCASMCIGGGQGIAVVVEAL